MHTPLTYVIEIVTTFDNAINASNAYSLLQLGNYHTTGVLIFCSIDFGDGLVNKLVDLQGQDLMGAQLRATYINNQNGSITTFGNINVANINNDVVTML